MPHRNRFDRAHDAIAELLVDGGLQRYSICKSTATGMRGKSLSIASISHSISFRRAQCFGSAVRSSTPPGGY